MSKDGQIGVCKHRTSRKLLHRHLKRSKQTPSGAKKL